MAKSVTCPDFDLAEMENFDPKLLMTYKSGQEELETLDAFIIVLGLIFNDLKGIYWWNRQLVKGEPEDKHNPIISAYYGQWSGMTIQVNRLALGIFAELLTTINENRKVLKYPLFKRVVKNLKSVILQEWNGLVSAAHFKNSDIKSNKKLFELIQEVRSNGVFHYQNLGEIHKGYKAHFKQEVPLPSPDFSTLAYYSLGDTIEKCRFYFSDAAIDGYSKMKAKKFHAQYGNIDISKFITESLGKISGSLRYIVEEYIKLRKKFYTYFT